MKVTLLKAVVVSFVLLCVVIKKISAASLHDDGIFNLTIAHYNDFHCYYGGLAKYSVLCSKNKKCYGGITRFNYLAKAIKNQSNVLFLNAGDNFHGAAYYKIFGWKIVADLMNYVPLDVMSLGNHEFDDKPQALKMFLKNVTVPCICANIEIRGDPELQSLINKSMVFNVSGKRIGVIGYVTVDTSFLSNPGPNVSFTDEITSIRDEARRLKANNLTDIIIALGHAGFTKDIEIAASVTDVDVVVGGHSNTFLYKGTPPIPNWPSVEGTYPYMVKQHNSSKLVPVVQAYAYGIFIGKLNLVFNFTTNELINASGDPILVNYSLPEDEETKKVFTPYKIRYDAEVNRTISYTSMLLEGGEICRQRECSGGNFFTDIFLINFLKTTMSHKSDNAWATASAVFINGGSIRTSIAPGPITIQDIYSTFPFQNELQVINVTGKQLLKSLEDAMKDVNFKNKPGRFPQLSGIYVKYNISQPVNHRVMEARVRCLQCLVPMYEPLQGNKTYSIITTDYLINGGDGITGFKNSTIVIEGNIFSEVAVDGMLNTSYFTELNGRVTLMGNATKVSTVKP